LRAHAHKHTHTHTAENQHIYEKYFQFIFHKHKLMCKENFYTKRERFYEISKNLARYRSEDNFVESSKYV